MLPDSDDKTSPEGGEESPSAEESTVTLPDNYQLDERFLETIARMKGENADASDAQPATEAEEETLDLDEDAQRELLEKARQLAAESKGESGED